MFLCSFVTIQLLNAQLSALLPLNTTGFSPYENYPELMSNIFDAAVKWFPVGLLFGNLIVQLFVIFGSVLFAHKIRSKVLLYTTLSVVTSIVNTGMFVWTCIEYGNEYTYFMQAVMILILSFSMFDHAISNIWMKDPSYAQSSQSYSQLPKIKSTVTDV